jgi:hypothetical protein
MRIKQLLVLLPLVLLPLAATAQVAGDLPVGTTPTTTPAPEVPKQTARERVRFLLSAYHLFPTPEQFATAGTEAEVSVILREITQDPNMMPSFRLRAMDALALFADNLTLALLEHTVSTPTDDQPENERGTATLLRHHAIMSFAKLRGEAALTALEPLLQGKDLQLKLTAISAIGKQCGNTGMTRLRKLRSSDEHRAVQHEIRKFIQK